MPRRARSGACVLVAVLALVLPPGSAIAAVAFDSAYVGESAFLSLNPGQSGTQTVFFQNTGSTAWSLGTASQVDLAACADDQITCDVAPSVSGWNPGGASGWRSTTRYATQSQAAVAPGAVGTFTYTVAAPSGVGVGLYRFNGDLVVAATGAKVHPEGYYHAVSVTAPSAPVVRPKLASAISQSLTQVLLTFSANMSCSSLAGGTYVIKDAGGTIIDQTASSANQITVQANSTSGAGASDCLTATLYMRESSSTALTAGVTYTVQATNVTDASGLLVDTTSNTAAVAGGGTLQPSAVSAAFLGPTAIRVTFSKPMVTSGGTSITNTANYLFDGTAGSVSLTACVASIGGIGADCTLFATPVAGQHTVRVTQVADTLGSMLSPDPASFTLAYPPASARPTVVSAFSSSATSLIATFDSNLATAGLGSCFLPGNYSLTNLDGSTSGLSLSVTSCSGNQATLELTGVTSGKSYILVVSSVMDTFGNIVNPNPASTQFTAGGPTTAPTARSATTPSTPLACDVASPAPCQRSQFTISFSAPMFQGTTGSGVSNTALYVLKDASGAAAAISGCAAVDARNNVSSAYVTCTLVRPVAAGAYTLAVGSGTAPTDITGNVLKTATFTLSYR